MKQKSQANEENNEDKQWQRRRDKALVVWVSISLSNESQSGPGAAAIGRAQDEWGLPVPLPNKPEQAAQFARASGRYQHAKWRINQASGRS